MERKKFKDQQPPKFMPFLFWQNGNQHKNMFAFTNGRNEIKNAVDGSCVFVLANVNPQWKELTQDEKVELINERKIQIRQFGFISLGERPVNGKAVNWYNQERVMYKQDQFDPYPKDLSQYIFWEYADEVKQDIPQDGRTISVGNVSDYVQSATGLKLKSFETLTPEELNQIIERETNANLYYRSSDGTFKQLPEGTTISNYARNSKGDYVAIKSGRIDDPEYQAMSFDKPVEITGDLNSDDPDDQFIDLIKMMLDDFLKYKNSGVLNLAKDIMANIEKMTGDKNIEVFELIESQKKVNDNE